jgi:hypothetical protein
MGKFLRTGGHRARVEERLGNARLSPDKTASGTTDLLQITLYEKASLRRVEEARANG